MEPKGRTGCHGRAMPPTGRTNNTIPALVSYVVLSSLYNTPRRRLTNAIRGRNSINQKCTLEGVWLACSLSLVVVLKGLNLLHALCDLDILHMSVWFCLQVVNSKQQGQLAIQIRPPRPYTPDIDLFTFHTSRLVVFCIPTPDSTPPVCNSAQSHLNNAKGFTVATPRTSDSQLEWSRNCASVVPERPPRLAELICPRK
jgi:hypothetical protein